MAISLYVSLLITVSAFAVFTAILLLERHRIWLPYYWPMDDGRLARA